MYPAAHDRPDDRDVLALVLDDEHRHLRVVHVVPLEPFPQVLLELVHGPA
jgi:hypothetical protein